MGPYKTICNKTISTLLCFLADDPVLSSRCKTRSAVHCCTYAANDPTITHQVSKRSVVIPFFTTFTLLGLYVTDSIFFRSLTGQALPTKFSGGSMFNLSGSLTRSTGFEFQQLVAFLLISAVHGLKFTKKKFHPKKFHPKNFHPKFFTQKFSPKKLSPKKIYTQKIFTQKIFTQNFSPKKLSPKKNFDQKFQQKNFTQKFSPKKFSFKKIITQKIFTQKIFTKKVFTLKYSIVRLSFVDLR